jgi:TonB-linked SusC/RagA family outer membrane protein
MQKIILLFLCSFLAFGQLSAQNRTINGKVVDEKGSPVASASLLVKGTSNGTVTNETGSFSLQVNASAKTLVVSSLNFASTEISLTKNESYTIVLTSKVTAAEEVVIVGYRTLRKKDVVGSISMVDGAEIAQKPIVNFTQLLQGKAAGVNVIGEGGRPGAGAFIRIRGVGSVNASSEPLIIVDGVQVSSTAFAMINPNDIGDIAILKDASSSAIYGSRAANGVIVVTTKLGKSSKPEIRYSFQTGISDAIAPKNVTFMSAEQKLQWEFERGYTNPYMTSLISAGITDKSLPAGSTLATITKDQREFLWRRLAAGAPSNWADFYLPTANMKQHEVSISGASDKFKYFMSLNKSDNEGVMYGSYFNRLGGRLNVEYTASEWLKTGMNLSVSQSKEDLKRELYNSQSSATALYLTNPYEPVRNADGTYNLTMQGFSALEGADNNPFVLDRISSYATGYAELKLYKDLVFKSQLGANYNTLKSESYVKGGSNLSNILRYNQKTDGGNFDFTYVFTNTLNYKKSIGKSNANLFLGQEFNRNNFYSYSLAARNFASPSNTTLENAGTPQVATTSRSEWSLISYFANASYDFDKTYFFNASVRRDGSSRFGLNNKFADFWSLGLAWDVKKEKFLSNIESISTFKLKASYGTAGNSSIGNYNSLGTYALSAKYNDGPVATPNSLPNPTLTWETNKTLDIGAELGFFNNRITAGFDYFDRTTDDLLYTVNVSATTGFSSYFGNIGNVRNKGYEITIGADVIRAKDFNWNLSFNYTDVDNEVTKLFSDDVPAGSNGRLKVGYPINNYFMVRSAGINPANGKRQYLTKDGKVTETYASSDAVMLDGKSPNVKFFGSLNSSFTYKGFDLNTQFYYSGGNYIYNFTYARGAYGNAFFDTQLFTEASNYWKKPGDNVPFPSITDATQNTFNTTDQWLQKGDYIMLRDLTMGYTANIPSKGFIGKLKLKSVRLFVQGTNLWFSTKFKGMPEVGQANRETNAYPGSTSTFPYPQTKSFTTGIDIRF